MTSTKLSDRARIAYLQEELDTAERHIENLEAALVSARKIGAAIGVLMGTRRLTYDQASDLLSRAGRQGNEKLRSVAERVLITGSTDR